MGTDRYDWNEIYEELKQMYKEGRFNFANITNKDKLPSVTAITNRFGGIKRLRREFEGETLSPVPPAFCRECTKEQITCGKKPVKCYEQAFLWRELEGKSFTVNLHKKRERHKFI